MRPRRTMDMPLIVRPLTRSAYEPKTKLALLAALGVPGELLKSETKILLVSSDQVIPSPSPPTSTDHDLDDGSSPNQTRPHDSLLPPGWIAIICGLPPKARPHQIPDRFFSITDSKFNYVPDLTAIADVVLGKLGYGTCSEVIATRTLFISVPRKMFVEEYGLKRLMKESSTINVEMSIKEFEDGRWASILNSSSMSVRMVEWSRDPNSVNRSQLPDSSSNPLVTPIHSKGQTPLISVNTPNSSSPITASSVGVSSLSDNIDLTLVYALHTFLATVDGQALPKRALTSFGQQRSCPIELDDLIGLWNLRTNKNTY
ncbi:hypothetical protein PGTUg99_000568 [Puccinia graminis f. sp. tritici]|uniref:Uncharacterized protein n=1 Tax=Puccinia graminis f. sp. tritici TaxID=56615 RepID=A0A5B0RH09_PUCGR|nr:hypothetical protein PGTUg99_000568 [Puccinia graminis f. sp. tritici]